jgi:hypothetical protein
VVVAGVVAPVVAVPMVSLVLTISVSDLASLGATAVVGQPTPSPATQLLYAVVVLACNLTACLRLAGGEVSGPGENFARCFQRRPR